MPTEISGSTGVNKIQDDTVVAADIASSVNLGKVLQVVQTSYSTQTSFSSQSWIAHGASATITPTSTSSKILITAQIHRKHDSTGGNDSGLGFGWRRGSTTVFETPVAVADYEYPGGSPERHEIRGWVSPPQKLDSPNTTSAVTYALYAIKHSGATPTFQDSQNETVITLMEIAG
jgi:hypothetical protein